MMLLATAAFFACAFPLSVPWYTLWRFAAGLAGGALMALAAPTVLPHVPAARQGLASGVIFTGVGLGIAASGTLVPPLLEFGLAETLARAWPVVARPDGDRLGRLAVRCVGPGPLIHRLLQRAGWR